MTHLLLATVICLFQSAQAQIYNPRADLEQGCFLKALTEAELRIKGNNDDALAWAVKTQALVALTRIDEALLAAEKSLTLSPKLSEALVARAMAKAGKAIQQKNFNSLRMISHTLDDLNAA